MSTSPGRSTAWPWRRPASHRAACCIAAYMLTIALFAIVVALWCNWRNDRLGYWLNLAVVSWADIVWVLVVVLPGYVPLARGLIPPAFRLADALCCTLARRDRIFYSMRSKIRSW